MADEDVDARVRRVILVFEVNRIVGIATLHRSPIAAQSTSPKFRCSDDTKMRAGAVRTAFQMLAQVADDDVQKDTQQYDDQADEVRTRSQNALVHLEWLLFNRSGERLIDLKA